LRAGTGDAGGDVADGGVGSSARADAIENANTINAVAPRHRNVVIKVSSSAQGGDGSGLRETAHVSTGILRQIGRIRLE
jgi:hypothetical protein